MAQQPHTPAPPRDMPPYGAPTQSQSQGASGEQHAPSPSANALGALADKLEKLRVMVAAKLEPDELAALQAAVVELAAMAGRPAESTPTPTSTPPPNPAAPTSAPAHKGA